MASKQRLTAALAFYRRQRDRRLFVDLFTLGWLNRSRRLSKNFERLTTSSEAMVYLAMLPVMTRRLAKQQTVFA